MHSKLNPALMVDLKIYYLLLCHRNEVHDNIVAYFRHTRAKSTALSDQHKSLKRAKFLQETKSGCFKISEHDVVSRQRFSNNHKNQREILLTFDKLTESTLWPLHSQDEFSGLVPQLSAQLGKVRNIMIHIKTHRSIHKRK